MIKENADKVSDNPSVSFADSSLLHKGAFFFIFAYPTEKSKRRNCSLPKSVIKYTG